MLALMDKDWHWKGLNLKHRGQYQKAIRAFDQAIDHKIRLAEAYYERGVCFYKLGNYRQASDDLAAAALLGCKAAELWSKYDRNRFKKSDEDSES
jgi:tetratricopeptide (TPR) repeat protein